MGNQSVDITGEFYEHKNGNIYSVRGTAEAVVNLDDLEVINWTGARYSEAPNHLLVICEVLDQGQRRLVYLDDAHCQGQTLVAYQCVLKRKTSPTWAPNGIWARPQEMFLDGRFSEVSTQQLQEISHATIKPCH